jgi:Hint domain
MSILTGWIRPTRPFVLIAAMLMLAACSSSAGASPGPTIIPAQTGGAPLTAGQLRLLLMDTFGPHWYCDPDVYPVAHGDEQALALQRFAEMQAEGDIFQYAALKLGIEPFGVLTDAEKLAIYQVWKVALSIPLDPIGDGTYRFDYLAQPAEGATSGTRTGGTIDANGKITIDQTASSGEPMCPICLARGTLIDTPDGEIAVDALRLGDTVWTLDATGNRIFGTVIAFGSTTAPADHRVIRFTLADGRSVTASPGHPLADGRTLGELAVGDLVDGSPVATLESLPYSGGETFDLVASGPTGTYLSSGIPLGSTLAPAR